MSVNSNYHVKSFEAASVSELAEKIEQYFENICAVATVRASYRNLSFFTTQSLDKLHIPPEIKFKYEAILTLRIYPDGADIPV